MNPTKTGGEHGCSIVSYSGLIMLSFSPLIIRSTIRVCSVTVLGLVVPIIK